MLRLKTGVFLVQEPLGGQNAYFGGMERIRDRMGRSWGDLSAFGMLIRGHQLSFGRHWGDLEAALGRPWDGIGRQPTATRQAAMAGGSWQVTLGHSESGGLESARHFPGIGPKKDLRTKRAGSKPGPAEPNGGGQVQDAPRPPEFNWGGQDQYAPLPPESNGGAMFKHVFRIS